jgi:hypothetical protein
VSPFDRPGGQAGNDVFLGHAIQASECNRFTIHCRSKETVEHSDLKSSTSVQAKDRPLL